MPTQKVAKVAKLVTQGGKGVVFAGKLAQNSKNKKVRSVGTKAVAVGRTARTGGRVVKGAANGRSNKATAKKTGALAKKGVARFA